jgi:subtilase family serine protease
VSPAITGNVTVISEVQNYPLVVRLKRKGLQRARWRRVQPFVDGLR